MRHIQLSSLVDRRRRRKLATTRSLNQRLVRLGLGCGAFLLLSVVFLLLGAGVTYASLVKDLPSTGLLAEMLDPDTGWLMQPTRLYDRSGQKLLMSLENPGIQRRYLTLDPGREEHISPELIRATVGALDPDYWSTPGFSLRYLTYSQPMTIAERLVDDLLLWKEPPGLRRALRMRLLAAQVVARYGHVQVLEWYLNSAYFGHQAFGADSAARLYLDKSAATLDLAESALLVAAIRAPALNAIDVPTAALERQRRVLDDLLDRNVIPAPEYQRALDEELRLASPIQEDASLAAAFSKMVIDRLSERFDRVRIERGGLRIITTLDYQLQLELTCLSKTQLARLTGEKDDFELPDGSACVSSRLLPTLLSQGSALSEAPVASAVVLNPMNGQVLAMLGDTTLEGETEVISPRQPGSLLTPFLAMASFARGQGPASLTWDIPQAARQAGVDTSLSTSASSQWANPDGKYRGPVRLRMALANDYLAPQAQILDQIGAENVWRLAGALGLSGLADEYNHSLLYEGGPSSPLELAQAYGVFAAQGVRVGQRITANSDLLPALVLVVDDLSGQVWWDARQPETQTVVSEQLAYLVHDVLADSTARWPSLGYPNALEIGRPVGAKVGQIQSGKQVWTVGYTPQRVAVFSLSLPENGSQASLGLPMVSGMWHALMQYAHRGLPVEDWTEPTGITHLEVCNPSGLLPTAACPETVDEVFLSGSEPTGPDTLYQAYQINRETGRLATVFTPANLVEEEVFLVVPAQARAWAESANLPVPPKDYDAIQPSAPSPDARISSPALYDFVRGQVVISGTAAGEEFRFYQVQVGQGLNPQTWLQVGQDGAAPVEGGELARWDTQGIEGLYSVRLLVVRSNQSAETAAIQVTVDNTPPAVRVPYPLNDQEFAYPAERAITFQAEANDALGLRRIVWLVDGRQVGESLAPPYAFTWTASRGEHTLQVKAYDLAGNEGVSEEVRFTVR